MRKKFIGLIICGVLLLTECQSEVQKSVETSAEQETNVQKQEENDNLVMEGIDELTDAL